MHRRESEQRKGAPRARGRAAGGREENDGPFFERGADTERSGEREHREPHERGERRGERAGRDDQATS